VIVAHDDSKGHTIRQGPYSLEALSLPQGHLTSIDSRGLTSTKISQKASGTLGARSAS
jgi:hypothetical protein